MFSFFYHLFIAKIVFFNLKKKNSGLKLKKKKGKVIKGSKRSHSCDWLSKKFRAGFWYCPILQSLAYKIYTLPI